MQLPLTDPDTLFEALLQDLPPETAHMAREFKAFVRAKKVKTPAQLWRVVFFWPMDFTFICPTEIAEFGRRSGEFAKRGAQVLGFSTDTHYVHLAWRRTHPDLRDLPIPMLADTNSSCSPSRKGGRKHSRNRSA